MREFGRRHPDIPIIRRFPGLFIAQTRRSPETVFAPWSASPPHYLQYGFTLKRILPLTGSNADLKYLRRYAGRLAHSGRDPGAIHCALHAASFADDRRLAYTRAEMEAAVATGRRRSVPNEPVPGESETLMLVARVGGKTRLFIGSCRPGLLPPRPADPPAFVINRAGHKLLEALETFRIQLRSGWRVLDLGSGTGAWSRIMATAGLYVTAVDPCALDVSLRTHARVTHLRLRAEEYLSRNGSTRFDFVTNDMILDPRDSSRLMARAAERLRPGGLALMTLKLPKGHERTLLDHSYRILRKNYRILRVRQLTVNRRELTVFMRKK